MQIQQLSMVSFNSKAPLKASKKAAQDIYSHEFKKASEPVGDVAKIVKEESTAEADSITSQYFPFANVTKVQAKTANAEDEYKLYF